MTCQRYITTRQGRALKVFRYFQELINEPRVEAFTFQRDQGYVFGDVPVVGFGMSSGFLMILFIS
jgi:hypothetical protein